MLRFLLGRELRIRRRFLLNGRWRRWFVLALVFLLFFLYRVVGVLLLFGFFLWSGHGRLRQRRRWLGSGCLCDESALQQLHFVSLFDQKETIGVTAGSQVKTEVVAQRAARLRGIVLVIASELLETAEDVFACEVTIL